jgi:hypothetical protein
MDDRALGLVGLLVLLVLLVLCNLCGGCGFHIQTEDSQAQIKALSQILAETDVMTCSKVTATFPPYIQVTSIWAGRMDFTDCVKALYPY